MAISLVTEGDVDILHNIEGKTGKKMGPMEGVEEGAVLDCLTEVGGAKRVANLALLDGNFGANARRNRDKRAGTGERQRSKSTGKRESSKRKA